MLCAEIFNWISSHFVCCSLFYWEIFSSCFVFIKIHFQLRYRSNESMRKGILPNEMCYDAEHRWHENDWQSMICTLADWIHLTVQLKLVMWKSDDTARLALIKYIWTENYYPHKIDLKIFLISFHGCGYIEFGLVCTVLSKIFIAIKAT